MNFIDIVLGVLILFGLVRGLFKGFFLEVASLVGFIAGLYGAIRFSYILADYLSEKVQWEEKYVQLTAFAITFLIIVLLITLAGKVLTKIADFAALGLVNKVLGGLFGALKVAVIMGAVLIFFERTNNAFMFVDEETTTSSALYTPVKDLGEFVFDWVLREGSFRKEE